MAMSNVKNGITKANRMGTDPLFFLILENVCILDNINYYKFQYLRSFEEVIRPRARIPLTHLKYLPARSPPFTPGMNALCVAGRAYYFTHRSNWSSRVRGQDFLGQTRQEEPTVLRVVLLSFENKIDMSFVSCFLINGNAD